MQHGAALDAVAHTATDRPMTDRSSAPHDIDLVQQMARGDDRALGLLYDRFGVVLYAVAFRVVGQAADAEEVVMEAFAQAWREAPRFDAARGSVAAWLTVMARSRALDLVRAQSRRAPRHRQRRARHRGDRPRHERRFSPAGERARAGGA
jgi:DNA-directed RNA polymerase specialized sigma24 family protein